LKLRGHPLKSQNHNKEKRTPLNVETHGAVFMKHEVLKMRAVFKEHGVMKIPECSVVLKISGVIPYRFSVTPSRTPMLDWGEDWLASSSSRQLNALSFHVCAMPESIYRCYSRPFLFVFSP